MGGAATARGVRAAELGMIQRDLAARGEDLLGKARAREQEIDEIAFGSARAAEEKLRRGARCNLTNRGRLSPQRAMSL